MIESFDILWIMYVAFNFAFNSKSNDNMEVLWRYPGTILILVFEQCFNNVSMLKYVSYKL